MIASNDQISQVEGYIVSDMDGEKVMLSVENGKYYNLGDIGGEIWDRLKEPVGMGQLIDTLVTQYDVDENKCRLQVMNYIRHLANEGLVKIEPQRSEEA